MIVATSRMVKVMSPNIASLWRRNWRNASDQSERAGRRSACALGAGARTNSCCAVMVVAIGCPLSASWRAAASVPRPSRTQSVVADPRIEDAVGHVRNDVEDHHQERERDGDGHDDGDVVVLNRRDEQ